MAYCCVPYCRSDGKKRKGISFHEFPVSEERRQIWIERISRKAEGNKLWHPNDRSKVCSNHFLPDDYSLGLKVKRLKLSAVPSIFEHYPTGRKAYLTPLKESPNIIMEVPFEKRKIAVNDTSNGNLELPIRTIDAGTSTSNFDEGTCTKTDRYTQTVSSHSVQMEKLLLKHRISTMQKKIKRMEKKLEKKKRDDNKKSTDYEYDIKNQVSLIIDVANNQDRELNPKAKFLLEQIRMFGKKKCVYSESFINQCISWQLTSSKGYEFARSSNILTLPSRTTIKRDIDCSEKIMDEICLPKEQL